MLEGNIILKMLVGLSVAASFLPLLISFFRFNQVKSQYPELLILVFISAALDLANRFNLISADNNFFVFHIYTVVEFLLITILYLKFFKRVVHPVIFFLVNIVFLSIAYIDYRINGLRSIDNLSISVESIILAICSLSLFYYVLKNLVFDNLLGSSIFWINTAILIYFSGNFFLFIFSDYLLLESEQIYNFVWSLVHSLFNIIYNLLLAIGFWKTKRI